MAQSGSPAAARERHVLVVFSGLFLAMFLAALDGTIVATALPVVAEQLGGIARISWVVTAYLLGETVATPLWGKFGDIYGRKIMLQLAIALFLIGSALCGLSQNMTELIAFRGLQGLGGGALMVTTQAAVGDIVSPRQRGRFQGIFGAGFGIASVAGPLLGGYFTSHLSWRWIFYLNIPLGAIALVTLAATFPTTTTTGRRSIDYLGAALLGIALAIVVLLVDLPSVGGSWASPWTFALAAVGFAALGAFAWAELRAAEPVMPLRLFRNRTVWVSSSVATAAGFVMFGAVTCLPLYLQAVKGSTPLASGLEMLPLMMGIPAASIASGQFITWTGRYRALPIGGAALATIGLTMMATMTSHTSFVTAAIAMLLLGVGLGMILQVVMIAVQNAVAYADLGVATSSAILFRFIGGAIGTAILGAVFVTGLPGEGGVMFAMNVTGEIGLKTADQEAVAAALRLAFGVAAGVGAAAFGIAWLLPALPLRQTIAAAETDVGDSMGRSFSMPAATDSATEFKRGVAVLAERTATPKVAATLLAMAALDFSPAAACLLLNAQADGRLGGCRDADALRELERLGFVERAAVNGREPHWQLTSAGRTARERLTRSRTERIERICSEWHDSHSPEIAKQIRKLVGEVIASAKME